MKKIGLAMASALCVFIAGPANAASIPGLYNTGVNNAGAVLGSGNDSHYALNGFFAPAIYNNGSYVQANDATYIAANTNGGYLINPNLYSLTFNLTGFDASTARLSGRFAADNAASVFLNGNLLAITGTFSAFTNFNANSGFLSGNNVLSFLVTDFGPPSALIVSGLNGTADALPAVPEPATWAMMLAGFGMVGFAMRRRQGKVTTNVRFA